MHGLLVPKFESADKQVLGEFGGGKRAEGDQRVGGCPVPALGPSCLNDGYSKTIDEKHIVHEGNWWRIVIFRYIRIIIQEKNMLRGIHALTTYASQIRDSKLYDRERILIENRDRENFLSWEWLRDSLADEASWLTL